MRLFNYILNILFLVGILSPFAFMGCAESDKDHWEPIATQIYLWNRTQSEILEARIHESTEYSEAENLLTEPLPVEARIELDIVTNQYVTVFRRRVADDDPIAFTTSRLLTEIDRPGFILIVFDKSFRLLFPEE